VVSSPAFRLVLVGAVWVAVAEDANREIGVPGGSDGGAAFGAVEVLVRVRRLRGLGRPYLASTALVKPR